MAQSRRTLMRRFPPYPRRPHASNQARIRVGNKDIYRGTHGSKESWAEYQRLLTEWRIATRGGTLPPPLEAGPVRTIADLVAAYLQDYEKTYPQRQEQLRNWVHHLRPLVRLRGGTAIVDFGARALTAVLPLAAAGAHLTDAERADRQRCNKPLDWSRDYANRALSSWKAVFRWGELHSLLIPGTYAALVPVRGLEHGQAREMEPVAPVDEETLAAALPHLNLVARTAVELLALT